MERPWESPVTLLTGLIVLRRCQRDMRTAF